MIHQGNGFVDAVEICWTFLGKPRGTLPSACRCSRSGRITRQPELGPAQARESAAAPARTDKLRILILIGKSFPIGARVDSSVFDPETKLAACSTGDGTIHIFHEDSPNAISPFQTVQTEFGAKTMALDAKTHNLLVDTSDFETPAVEGKQKSPQPRAKPGTFRLLILWTLTRM